MKCKCGSTMFTKNYRAWGTWSQLLDYQSGKGALLNSSTDSLRNGGEPKTVTCADCGKRSPNPDYKP